jgi:hypothetical protein
VPYSGKGTIGASKNHAYGREFAPTVVGPGQVFVLGQGDGEVIEEFG